MLIKKEIPMKHFLIAISSAALMTLSGCTEQKAPEPPKQPESVREKAETVGKFADQTVTTNMEKGLTGAVDASAQRDKDMEKSAEGK